MFRLKVAYTAKPGGSSGYFRQKQFQGLSSRCHHFDLVKCCYSASESFVSSITKVYSILWYNSWKSYKTRLSSCSLPGTEACKQSKVNKFTFECKRCVIFCDCWVNAWVDLFLVYRRQPHLRLPVVSRWRVIDPCPNRSVLVFKRHKGNCNVFCKRNVLYLKAYCGNFINDS